ncbi:MAG: hypothetical protein Q8N63_08315, partial [Nanoarchaeota archaeon]|nr:hypothetical protein [Nanoarchaeota archaeon]
MTEIDDIIAGMNPDKYTARKEDMKPVDISGFKKALKKDFSSAIKDMEKFNLKSNPAAQHKLTYNSPTEALEQFYFWILNFMNGMFGGKVEKLVDNFASSPGSGHFGEIQDRVNRMQQQATNIMQTVNAVLRTVLNIIYDLKEFQIRLSHYDAANSKDKAKAEAGLLALKAIWMDKVDIQRGGGSINSMSTSNLQFVTLRNAFMAANSLKEADELDLNDLVKRVLKPRVQEFFEWKKLSEQQLRKQFEIEKSYLKSQVNSLKLYARWAKPYLRAISQLTPGQGLANSPDLVNIFNNVLLQLTLMGRDKLDVAQAVVDKDLPADFKRIKKLRNYNSVVFIDFNFRGIPGRSQYGERLFTGRVEVTFKSYALNDDEINLLKDKLENNDLKDSLKLIEGMTEESLAQIEVDIEEFLGKEEKEEKKEEDEDINPFSALFSFFKPEKKDKKEKEKESIEKLKQKGVPKDTYPERYIRNFAEAKAIDSAYAIFDVYKKAHDMASLPYIAEAEAEIPRSPAEELFGFGK